MERKPPQGGASESVWGQVKPSEPQSDEKAQNMIYFMFQTVRNTNNFNILNRLDTIVPGPARGYGDMCTWHTSQKSSIEIFSKI